MITINYCAQCGSPVQYRIPEGDNRPRFVCSTCHFVHYQNPKIVAGCLATYEDKILFCKRAIEPRKGLWTLPAGFMENEETVEQAAHRETWEEARAKVGTAELYAMLNLSYISQVYMMYRGSLLNADYGPGPESEAVMLLTVAEIPWDEIAFPVIAETLKLYAEDLKHGHFRLHSGDIVRPQQTISSRGCLVYVTGDRDKPLRICFWFYGKRLCIIAVSCCRCR